MEKFWETTLSAFKYVLAIFMIVMGILTAMSPVSPAGGDLGLIFSSRLALIAFGAIFSASGAALLYGKIKRSRRWTGRGLLAIYLCFVFSALLNAIAFGFAASAWIANTIGSVIVGALWLRWRVKTEYVDPKHFIDDVDGLDLDGPPSRRYRPRTR